MFDKITWAGIRQGLTASITMQVTTFIVPIIVAGIVAVIGRLIDGLPWAYVAAASFSGMALTFGGVAAGLNQFVQLRERLREEDSLTVLSPIFQWGSFEGASERKGLSPTIGLRNNANYPLKCEVTDYEFELYRKDGSARSQALRNFDNSAHVIGPTSISNFVLPPAMLEGLEQEQVICGHIVIKARHGRVAPKFEKPRKFKVEFVKQKDGSWNVDVAAVNVPR